MKTQARLRLRQPEEPTVTIAMNLADLNDRWRATGKPHAISDDGNGWIWCCPSCQKGGRTRLPLHAAMSDALAHKQRCLAVE